MESWGSQVSCLCHLGKAVTVNGMPVTLPKSYSGSGLTLEKVGVFVSVYSTSTGVTLLWDGGRTTLAFLLIIADNTFFCIFTLDLIHYY